MTPRALLLPGLDGTGTLFEPLLRTGLAGSAVAYPHEPLDYDALEGVVRAQLPDEPFLLVAESFSGPVGIQIAADPPKNLVGLCLVASFACPPVQLPTPEVGWLALGFRVTPPRWVLRQLLLEPESPDALVDQLLSALSSVPPDTLAYRLEQVQHVDVTSALRRTRCPISYLRATRDRLVRSHALHSIRRCRPDVQVCQVEAPHLVLQTRPIVAAHWLESRAAASARVAHV